ncbi:succinoglycan biosynthesis protein ExoA [Candidatus Brocadiaceae bacterium]|nr:succinoglycan biosynthesis protein ExoA [Candidatus Brocadiaceae bacterium]
MNNEKYVSVIIPIFNEKKYIRQLLNSLLQQDYPKDWFEILLIDGRSEDGTREEIKEIMASSPEFSHLHITVLDNPNRIVPCALNIGIKEARGKYIIRMDAHSEYAANYVSKCIEWLEKTNAANVGGPMMAVGNGYIGKAIEFAHHCRFGLGGGRFHDEQWSGYVDTVYLGAWPKRIFTEVGLFDERLIRNQDIEFNARIRKGGGRIYLTPKIQSYYHCRNSLGGLWKQNFENGKWVVYTKTIAPYALSWRHFIPFVFVASLIGSASLSVILFCLELFSVSDISQFRFSILSGFSFVLPAGIFSCYALANILSSAMLSYKQGFRYFFMLPIVFATLHFSYGLGSIWGLLTVRKWVVKNTLATKARRH